jgi:hypothetical protein
MKAYDYVEVGLQSDKVSCDNVQVTSLHCREAISGIVVEMRDRG